MVPRQSSRNHTPFVQRMCSGHEARYDSRLRRVSATLSPPNLSSAYFAKVRRTMASATTDAAGTAVLSERWVDGLCGFAGQHVDRTQGLGDGRNRLHGTAYANHLAIGHTAFNAACAVGQTVDTAVGVDHDLIVRLRTGAGGFQEAVADSTPLNA